nr:DUF222 domain-containing protein [Tomitella biformata]
MRPKKRALQAFELTSISDSSRLQLPEVPSGAAAADILSAIAECDRNESFIAYTRYAHVALLHADVSTVPPDADKRLLDDFAMTTVELSAVRRATKSAATATLAEALAMESRIPLIGECLRDGHISPRQFQRLVTFTDLIDREDYASQVDAAIAAELRLDGTWSDPRLRDLVYRVISRHDPDAVRRRHEAAKRDRGCHAYPLADGMAELRITATPEDVDLAMAAVRALALTVCEHDGRSAWARQSDAAVSRLQGVPFACQCDRPDCTSAANGLELSEQHARIVVHVVCGCETLDDEGHQRESGPQPGPSEPTPEDPAPEDPAPTDEPSGADTPGFLNGHGLISAGHVRDIAARPDAVVRFLNKPGEALATHLPSDPYRFSRALDTFIRARDGYCVFPGCNCPAWAGDLDHVGEFDHRNPARGGQTSSHNGNAKCRFHHLVKTFTDWLDDQYLGPDGRTRIEFRSPRGLIVEGRGHTNEVLFPGLRDIEFHSPAPPQTARPSPEDRAPPRRRRTRIADKLARRRHERKLNRLDRLSGAHKRAHPATGISLPTDPDF